MKIPVLALVDSDPYGLKILSVYSSGSKQMSYDSSHLTTSDIKWLGVSSLALRFKPSRNYPIKCVTNFPISQVRPSDLDRYNLPAQCRLQLTEHDRKMGEELLQEAFVQRHPEWVKELQIMLKSGEKAEIQVMAVGTTECFFIWILVLNRSHLPSNRRL